MEWNEETKTQHNHTNVSYKQNIQWKKPGQKNIQGMTPLSHLNLGKTDLKC